jgi:hypothetical protein
MHTVQQVMFSPDSKRFSSCNQTLPAARRPCTLFHSSWSDTSPSMHKAITVAPQHQTLMSHLFIFGLYHYFLHCISFRSSRLENWNSAQYFSTAYFKQLQRATNGCFWPSAANSHSTSIGLLYTFRILHYVLRSTPPLLHTSSWCST